MSSRHEHRTLDLAGPVALVFTFSGGVKGDGVEMDHSPRQEARGGFAPDAHHSRGPNRTTNPIYPHARRPSLRAAWRSALGMKVVMALSAIVLVGYMLIHVLGNLLIFLGPAWINGWLRASG